MTLIIVISVFPSDDTAVCVTALVLLLLLPAPAGEEDALAEEVLVGGDEFAWNISSLGAAADELQVLAESRTDSASTWVVFALRAAGVEPAGTCCRLLPLSVGSKTDLTFRRISSDTPFSLPILCTKPTDCDMAGVPWSVLVGLTLT